MRCPARTICCRRSLAIIEQAAPLRHMVTPGGFVMSVAMTNCGALGWTSDSRGYRYTAEDPQAGRPWPAMPVAFAAPRASRPRRGGVRRLRAGRLPDQPLHSRAHGCRCTRTRRARLLRADRLGVAGHGGAFLFGGHTRTERPVRLPLRHGDVVVWGGEDRLRFHGVSPLKDEPHPLLGSRRPTLTFRRAAVTQIRRARRRSACVQMTAKTRSAKGARQMNSTRKSGIEPTRGMPARRTAGPRSRPATCGRTATSSMAVRTTGVYCRPSRPTRVPERENVEFFATEREAEAAGYRPSQRAADRTARRGTARGRGGQGLPVDRTVGNLAEPGRAGRRSRDEPVPLSPRVQGGDRADAQGLRLRAFARASCARSLATRVPR